MTEQSAQGTAAGIAQQSAAASTAAIDELSRALQRMS